MAPGVTPARAFGAFAAADNRADAYALAKRQVGHAIAELDHRADRFMFFAVAAGDARPAISFQLAAADGAARGLYEDFAISPVRRRGGASIRREVPPPVISRIFIGSIP